MEQSKDSPEYILAEREKQDLFLEDMELSKPTTIHGKIKKEVAIVLQNDAAYNILQCWDHIEGIKKEVLHIFLKDNGRVKEFVELSEREQEALSRHASIIYTMSDIEPNKISNINFIVTKEKPKKKKPDAKLPKREDVIAVQEVWGEIRKDFIEQNDINSEIDKNWLSKLEYTIDQEKKTLYLKAPNVFYRDLISERFQETLGQLTKKHGLTLERISS